jgi:hypothetical protein
VTEQQHGARNFKTSLSRAQTRHSTVLNFDSIVQEAHSVVELNSDYTRSAAHHEAAHMVIAAVQRIPLTEKGIHLDRWGNGVAHYCDRKPDGSTNVGPEPEREKTIIATFAGCIAQNRIRPCSESGAFYDINQVNALLGEMYPDSSPSWWSARATLCRESERLVEVHWAAIESVALALWSKPDIPKMPELGERSPEPVEKYLSVNEIVEILRPFGIAARIERKQTEAQSDL